MPKIAFVADVHHGKDVMTKKSSQGLRLLADFAAFVATGDADIVVDLGDRISDENHDRDLVLEREVADAFRTIPRPVHHINGNHDRDFISVAENEAILGQTLGHELVDLGDWQLILWRADTHIHRRPEGSSFQLAEGDLDWLAASLAAAGKPSVLATHVPLSGQSQRSNYYFHNNAGIASYPELDAIQAVLRAAHVPLVCVSGHVHWNSVVTVDGIPHITLQSLTESCTTGGEPAEAWGVLELGDIIRWTAHGRQHFAFETDAASTMQRWKEPHGNFHEMRLKPVQAAG